MIEGNNYFISVPRLLEQSKRHKHLNFVHQEIPAFLEIIKKVGTKSHLYSRHITVKEGMWAAESGLLLVSGVLLLAIENYPKAAIILFLGALRVGHDIFASPGPDSWWEKSVIPQSMLKWLAELRTSTKDEPKQ